MIENPLLKFLILYAAASSPGWLFACIGISGMRDTRKRKERERAMTTGTVVDHIRYQGRRWRDRHGRRHVVTYWRSVVEFTAEGRPFRLESFCLDGRPAVGETIDIWYDPDDPTHFHQVEQLEQGKGLDAFMIAGGVIWLFFSLFLAAKAL